jgi:Leu/Phe-tRNA-protein transferase
MDNLSFGDLLGSLWGLALVAIFFGGSIFVHSSATSSPPASAA